MGNEFLMNLSQSVMDPTQLLWARFLAFMPNLIAALVILVVGWLVAAGLDKLITQILKQVKLDQAMNSIGAHTFFKKAGWDLEMSDFVGNLLRWTLLLVAFLGASDVLGLAKITDFLTEVLAYMPSLFVAIGVLLIGFLAAHFFSGVVRGFVGTAKIKAANFLGATTRWSIYIFTIIVALQQLGIASQLLATFYTAMFAMIAIAGGLAFGLGGQVVAKKWLEDLQHEWTHREK